MNKPKPLIEKNKIRGLRPWCSRCDREIRSGTCGKTTKSLRTCKDTEYHMYKAFVMVPGTKRIKTRELGTTDVAEAMMKRKEFIHELKSQNFQATDAHLPKGEVKPMLLIECMALYVGFLNNEGVEEHQKRKRSDKHLWEIENHFTKFCKALKSKDIDHTIFKVDEINDRVVSHFHTYILDELGHANKTYNKIMGTMRQFIAWLIDKKKYEITNPFTSVQRRVENQDKTIISAKEFQTFLTAINPEKRWYVSPKGKRENRYKDWLEHAFRLALETGLRREEFMCLQFSDVILNEEGQPLFLKVENYKVNRIRGGKDVSNDVKSVPITQGLLSLLQDLEFDKYKGTDRFLIGHEETTSRNALIELVSKAFTHYWNQTGIKRKVMLKHLRKTYLTALVEHFGDKAPTISDHSGIEVIMKHYANSERLVSASQDFSIF